MSVETIARKLTELCIQGKHFEAMRTLYGPEMVSVEGDGKETSGKDAVIKKSELFQGANQITGQDIRGPFFCGDSNANSGKFALYFSLTFTPKSTGKSKTHEEFGLYSVKNDIITREEFYYDDVLI